MTEENLGDIETGRADSATAPAERNPVRSWVWKLAVGLFAMTGLILLAATVDQSLSWPRVRGLATRPPERTAFIDRYIARQREAGQPSDLQWRWVPYDSISANLKRAVLVAEDIEFFSHSGFAISEIKLAAREALAGDRELRGASTITQQLAKNLWLSPSRNPLRKAKEALLTIQLERSLSKKRILELYLNVVEFGPGIYGAEAAAQSYFSKSASQLSAAEAAQLAASLPRPLRWNPRSDSESYRRYASQIVERMDRAQFLRRRI